MFLSSQAIAVSNQNSTVLRLTVLRHGSLAPLCASPLLLCLDLYFLNVIQVVYNLYKFYQRFNQSYVGPPFLFLTVYVFSCHKIFPAVPLTRHVR